MASFAGSKTLVFFFFVIALTILIIILIIAYRYEFPEIGVGESRGCQGVGPPIGLSAVSFQLQNIRLNWIPAPGAIKYKIFVGTIPDVKETTAIQDYLVQGNQSEFVISNLILGRTYYFKMKSLNACGTASIFSGEAFATVGYPPIFRIVSRDQPNLALRVAVNFQDIEVGPLCSGNPGDTSCLWTFDQSTGYISSIDSPSVCLTAKPTISTNEIFYEACSELFFAYAKPYGVWNYTPQDGSLCHADVGDGVNCLKIDSNNTNVIKSSFDGSTTMKWDIIEFQP